MSARNIAGLTGASVPRVLRVARRLNLLPDLAGQRRRKSRFSPDESIQLVKALDAKKPRRSISVEGLTPAQVATFAAIAQAPLGLHSAREVARRAGISPTTASAALRILRDRDLITATRRTVAEGKAVEREVLTPNHKHRSWPVLAPIAQAIPRPPIVYPTEDFIPNNRKVPKRFAHLFWNIQKPSSLDVIDHGPLIARRILASNDPRAIGWAAATLRPSAWVDASRTRGLSRKDVSFALLLAGQ